MNQVNQAELHLILDAQGQLRVAGPIENKVLCLGLLELAKKCVLEYDPQAIQAVGSNGNGVPLFGGKRG